SPASGQKEKFVAWFCEARVQMVAYLLPRLSTPDQEQDLPPVPIANPTRSVLLRVRQTAHAIADRVRHAMLPEESNFTPLRVLVVDDHPDAADSLGAVLEMLDCPVRVCYDGATALAIAETFQPQVCLLDLMMPRMDGLELA